MRCHLFPAVLLIAIACALPFVLPSYAVFEATLVITYAVALLGLNLLTGFNGQISLGHGAFFALGAYTAAVLMEHAGWPYCCLLYTSPSPRDGLLSRMPSSA